MRTSAFLAALVALLLGGAAASPYETAPVTAGGTITGVVKYAGVAPKREQLEISKDKDVCGATPLFDQSLIVSSGGGISNAVVTITDIPKGEPMRPVNGVIFDQIGCEYSPHVVAFPAGSSIKVLNSDGILHSIHTESTINPVVDMAQPGFKKTLNVTIEKPEAIHVTCDAHNWMDGWWYATGNPYFAITGPDGRFSILNVPPGNYTLQVWQEKLGTMSHKVTVTAGKSVTADFTMKPAKD
jgi:Carboxypeptidase regulatory-like domain